MSNQKRPVSYLCLIFSLLITVLCVILEKPVCLMRAKNSNLKFDAKFDKFTKYIIFQKQKYKL
nr:hypothetical protein CFF04554_1755 [Campylobacter fetus subsp. fetus 04/554]